MTDTSSEPGWPEAPDESPAGRGRTPEERAWWKKPLVLGAGGAVLVALVALGIALAAGHNQARPSATPTTQAEHGSVTTTTRATADNPATGTVESNAPGQPATDQPAGSATSRPASQPTDIPATTGTVAPATTAPAASATAAAPPGATSTGCTLAVHSRRGRHIHVHLHLGSGGGSHHRLHGKWDGPSSDQRLGNRGVLVLSRLCPVDSSQGGRARGGPGPLRRGDSLVRPPRGAGRVASWSSRCRSSARRDGASRPGHGVTHPLSSLTSPASDKETHEHTNRRRPIRPGPTLRPDRAGGPGHRGEPGAWPGHGGGTGPGRRRCGGGQPQARCL